MSESFSAPYATFSILAHRESGAKTILSDDRGVAIDGILPVLAPTSERSRQSLW